MGTTSSQVGLLASGGVTVLYYTFMSEIPEESWVTILDFPDYEVSDQGRVRSKPRILRDGRRRQSTTLCQVKGHGGYLQVQLRFEGRVKIRRVHQLVAEAFLGPRPSGLDTRHGPGGKQDNRIENLSYGTRAENEQDKKRDGTFHHGGSKLGEENQNAVLTAEKVIRLRHQYALGRTQVSLAAEYGVTQATVSQIVKGKTWKHLL